MVKTLSVLLVASVCSPIAAQQVPKGQMPTLGRPTEGTDQVPLFDFDTYFLGKWTFEWSMPESPLGPAGPYSGTTVVLESRRTLLRSDDRRRRTVRSVQGARAHRVSQGKQGARAAGDRLARFQLHAVWSGGRRPRRDLQHSLRQRTVHRERQVGARATRPELALATQLSSGELHLCRRRRLSRISARRGGERRRRSIRSVRLTSSSRS